MSRRLFAPVPVFVVALLTLVQLVVVPVVLRTATHARAATTPGQIGLRVESARTVNATDPNSIKKGDPVTTYKWLITADDTGNVNDPTSLCVPESGTGASAGSYNPDRCQWPSTRYTPGNVAVVAEGDQTDFAPGTNGNSTLFYSLDPGKYLISVTANGYKIDGAHFTVAGGDSQQVVVSMQPYPLPLGTLRLRVFHDTAPVDGTYEVGVEKPLAGFTTHLNDVLGEVTTDFYGNRLCTNYVRRQRQGRRSTRPASRWSTRRTRAASASATRMATWSSRTSARTATPRRSSRPPARSGTRPRPLRGTTTGTCGSPRARPASTPR